MHSIRMNDMLVTNMPHHALAHRESAGPQLLGISDDKNACGTSLLRSSYNVYAPRLVSKPFWSGGLTGSKCDGMINVTHGNMITSRLAESQ